MRGGGRGFVLLIFESAVPSDSKTVVVFVMAYVHL